MCEGERLPRFIVDEFDGFLRCGSLAGGFARFRCDGCGLDRLVPFSCKGRAVCPSCGGRRMAERAAHLVDHVFPGGRRPPVGAEPAALGFGMCWRRDHALCRAVVGVFMRAVLGVLPATGPRPPGRRERARPGAVAIIQRFGAAFNLNVHVHALVLDGVYGEDGTGGLCFHPVTPPTDDEMDEVLAAVARRIDRLLALGGMWTRPQFFEALGSRDRASARVQQRCCRRSARISAVCRSL